MGRWMLHGMQIRHGLEAFACTLRDLSGYSWYFVCSKLGSCKGMCIEGGSRVPVSQRVFQLRHRYITLRGSTQICMKHLHFKNGILELEAAVTAIEVPTCERHHRVHRNQMS